MLNEFRSTNITWDKATSRIYSSVTANESDENGRKLVVQILNGGQIEDLTGATLHLYWETRDKAHYGLDVFKGVDLKKGEFELSYTTGMLSNHGVLNAHLVLVDTVGRVVSEQFKITVTEGIDDDAVQSENSFSSLTQALIGISDLEQSYAPMLSGLTAQLQQNTKSIFFDPAVTDYTSTIQAALDEGGKIKLVGAGTWVTGRLEIGSNTTLILDDGVILRKKDGTNHYLISNKGHRTGTIDKNISLIGGEFQFNREGNPNAHGDLLADPQSWPGIGILFNGVKNLKIKDVKKVGGEGKYCYLITNIEGFEADNIEFDNASDGLHFEPPMKNVVINNIRGYCGDDTISFTMGDYKRYSLGNYGDIENVVVQNVIGGMKNGVYTAELVKLVGNGLDGNSKFKNIIIRNLSGGCQHYPVCILREDTVDGNLALTDTYLENVVVENIDVILPNLGQSYVKASATSGDITIRNVKVDTRSRYFQFTDSSLDLVKIENIYNNDTVETPVNMSWFARFDGPLQDTKQVVIKDINLNLNTGTTATFVSVTGNLGKLDVSNLNIDAPGMTFFGRNGGNDSKTTITMDNSRYNGRFFLISANKIDVYASNSVVDIADGAFGVYMSDGCDVNIEAGNSIFNNFKVHTPTAVRKARVSGYRVELHGTLLRHLIHAKPGDILNSNYEPEKLKGLVIYDGNKWSKYRFTPFEITESVSLGTVPAHSTVEVTLVATESGEDVNTEIQCNPAFVLPPGLMFTAYNRDSARIRLRVANVTDSAISVPDGNWVFYQRR